MNYAAGVADRWFAGRRVPVDRTLLGSTLILLAVGWIMVFSASVAIAEREIGVPFYYALRHGVFIGFALAMATATLFVPMKCWERGGQPLLVASLVLLGLVLIPGIGVEINGSRRWIGMGVANLQVSEFVKLWMVLYLAGYLDRRHAEVRTEAKGFVKPMIIVGLIAGLLLAEPDFGAAAVLTATVLMMMFLAGVRLRQFAVLVVIVVGLLAVIAVSAPYRLQRLTTFLNPWADPFNSGFQLTQSLIAFGRGEWFGVGLGASVQKLYYLPEAHTDFLFAVLAEELGLICVLAVLCLYGLVVWRAFAIGRRALERNRYFSSYVAYGIGSWIGLQSVVNIGVSMGVLPTKGLTLPLLSYGGSSLLVTCIAVALLLRIEYENRVDGGARLRGFWQWLCR